MKCEITKEAFSALVPIELPSFSATQIGSAYIIEWESMGVKVIQIDNHISCCSQYFIEDINA